MNDTQFDKFIANPDAEREIISKERESKGHSNNSSDNPTNLCHNGVCTSNWKPQQSLTAA